jgi:hypothetical protein
MREITEQTMPADLPGPRGRRSHLGTGRNNGAAQMVATWPRGWQVM